MTKRSRGVSKTRCRAMVNSTTPRFGPRCPPVWERTLISSSRTSCASCGRSCSRSALMSAGERIPSSKRFGASVASVVRGFSEEFDFVIGAFGFDRCFVGRARFLRRLEFLYYWFPGAVPSNDFNLLLGVGKTFLADFYQLHPFLVPDDQIFEWQFTRFHLLDNFLEPIHRALKVRFRLARLRFTTHGENGGIKHTFARKKGRLMGERTTVASAVAAEHA